MKITKSILDSLAPGQTAQYPCSAIEKLRAQAYISQRRMVTGIAYSTSYDRQAEILTISRPEQTQESES